MVNNPLLSIESWLFNGDPELMVYETLRMQLCSISSPTYTLLRGSGYLGYVDSNQGYNPYNWVICPQILGL